MSNNKDIFINGPVNYIKIYNKEKNKTVIILMDYHVPIDKQKKCEEYDAKDVNMYIYKELKETKVPLDFFLEIVPTEVNNMNKYYSNDNYITETKKIFKKIYAENQSKPNSNIRLHYIDVRDYSYIYNITNIVDEIISILKSNKLDNILFIIEKLKKINLILELVNNYIELTINSKIKYESIDLINISLKKNIDSKDYSLDEILTFGLAELLDKILNKYTNKELKNNITKYFKENYIKLSKKLVIYIKELIQNVSEIYLSLDKSHIQQNLIVKDVILNNKLELKSKYIGYGIDFFEYDKQWENILNETNKLQLIIIKMGSVFMDCFFLRRLLEKNQIKKSIVYTGLAHSVMYIWFLVKFYDYSIEDYYFIAKDKLDKNAIKDLEIKIKKSESPFDIFEFLVPPKLTQCIKIK